MYKLFKSSKGKTKAALYSIITTIPLMQTLHRKVVFLQYLSLAVITVLGLRMSDFKFSLSFYELCCAKKELAHAISFGSVDGYT